jgi:hypothetical protein
MPIEARENAAEIIFVSQLIGSPGAAAPHRSYLPMRSGPCASMLMR